MKKELTAIFGCLLFLAACSESVSEKKAASLDCSCNKDSMQVVMNLPQKVKPEFVSAYKMSFNKCAAETLKEPGCLVYEVYQSFDDSTLFFITETWANKGEHLKHMETPHLKALIEETKNMGDSGDTRKSAEIYVCKNVN